MEKQIYLGLGNIGSKAIYRMWQTQIMDANTMMEVVTNDSNVLNSIAEPEYRIHKTDLSKNSCDELFISFLNNSEKLMLDLDLLQIEDEDHIIVHIFDSVNCDAFEMGKWMKKAILSKAPCEVSIYGYFFGMLETNTASTGIIASTEDMIFDNVYTDIYESEESFDKLAGLCVSFVEGLPKKQSIEEIIQILAR